MKYRIFAFLSAFIIFINCIGLTSLTVCASGHSGGGGYRSGTNSLEGSLNWTVSNKIDFLYHNISSLLINSIGILVNPSRWTSTDIMDGFKNYHHEWIEATSSESFEDYIQSNFYFENDKLSVSDKGADDLYNYINLFIKENCGYYTGQTFQAGDLTSLFTDMNLYTAISNVVKNMNANEYGFVRVGNQNFSYADSEGNTHKYSVKCTLYVYSVDGFVMNSLTNTIVNPYYEWNNVNKAENAVKKIYAFDDAGKDLSAELNAFLVAGSEYNSSYPYPLMTYCNLFTTDYCATTPKIHINAVYVIKPKKESVRVYKTYEDYKDYSVGNRPYYVTDKFQDYDINGDNSCIISESDLSNGSVYGDVYNYIINNYDNPDGLTEEELRRILDEYFDRLNDDDNDDDDSGDGLLDFLDGLGGFFDGILSVLGKLLEYIGKAVTLVTDTLASIVDKIPSSVTGMLAAAFPMLPEEWFSIIELALVLGLLGIVIKLLKG